MDGVVTDTAQAHATAWKRLFDEFLRARSETLGEAFVPFDARTEYRRYVDGKPRYDGVESFLRARGIELARGDVGDEPGDETVCALGNRKDRYFNDWLDRHAVRTYPGALALIRAVRAAHKRTALFSSSRNAHRVLRSAGILDLFDARVDGVDLAQLGLAGKPDPAMLLEAVARLGVAPRRAAVFEDAVAGVQAGTRGGFGLVIGVSREGLVGSQADALREAGANVVVAALSEVRCEANGLSVKTLDALPGVSDSCERIEQRLREAELAIFLDYDGTLTPIVEDHTRAFLSDAMRETLRRLAQRHLVAVISGRDLPQLRELVGLEEIYYAGSHGFDLAGPGGWHQRLGEGERFLEDLDAAEHDLREGIAGIEGHSLERKTFDIAVHYRRVPASRVAEVEPVVDRVLKLHPRLRKGRGKKVFEIRPDVDWDKGRAVRWLLAHLGLDRPGVVPVYVGDDLTDEDAFRELAGAGLAVAVRDGARDGARNTSADFGLDDPQDVRAFLEFLGGSGRRRR